MAKDKTKKGRKTPAEQLISEFLKLHNISIILDNINTTVENIPGVFYTVDQRPRIRFFFKEDLMKPTEKTNGATPKMEIN